MMQVMKKTELIKQYPVLEKYKQDKDFTIKAYHFLIDKVTEGLNIEECKRIAKETLDYGLVSALNTIEDFKKGTLRVNKTLDESLKLINDSLENLKKFFYTPKSYPRVSQTTMFIRRKEEVAKVIWLIAGYYIEPTSLTTMVNEVTDNNIVRLKFNFVEKGVNRFVRINLHQYKINKKRLYRIKIVPANKADQIIEIVNIHFGCFKISSVFATETIGDVLFIYPTRNRKDWVKMNLFDYEDIAKQLRG